MRLSDLQTKGRSGGGEPAPTPAKTNVSVAPVEARRDASVPDAPVALPPSPHKKDPRPIRVDSRPVEDRSDALRKAAERFDIAIPQNRGFVLRKGREPLVKIFQTATRPSEKKDGVWEATRHIANDLTLLLVLDPNLGCLLEYDPKEKERLVSHSVNTCLIALDLAKAVDNVECSLQEIGAAGLLHDIGLAGRGLDSADDRVVKSAEHVARGLEFLDEMKVPKMVKTIVAQHHERTNGTGYPNKIEGKSLLIGSQILALSETFERVMFRSFRESADEGVSDVNYVRAVLNEFHGALDQKLLKVFISLKGFYPNGIRVELTDHSSALVLNQNKGYPLQPIVQVVEPGGGNHQGEPGITDLRHSALSVIHALTSE